MPKSKEVKDKKIKEETEVDKTQDGTNTLSKVSSFCKTNKKTKEKKESTNVDVDTSFILKDINIVNLDRSYGMKDIQDLLFKNTVSKNTDTKTNTKLINTNQKNDLKVITTKLENLGFSEKSVEPFETLVRGNIITNLFTTFNNKRELLVNKDQYNCWYCRHPLPKDVIPLSIPIRYYSSYTECSLVHNSLINTVNKLEYKINLDSTISTIKDKDKIFYEKYSLSEKERNKYNPETDKNKTIETNDYFEGEGIVCSFNCMLAYISDNNCIKYKNTGMLINKLYKHFFGNFPKQKIVPSPSWRLLIPYGGNLTIEEYRNSFQTIDYSNAWQYNRAFPNGPISEIFLENKI